MNKRAPHFGTAGLSESYKAQGHKNMLQVAEYLAAFGLDAFEYQSGRGVRLADEAAQVFVATGAKYGITYSIHAPYYISMSSLEEEKRLGSIRYLLQSAEAVKKLGGRRVIFHPGSAGKQDRSEALEKAKDTLRLALAALDEAGFTDITLCPETMGKIGQIGTLEEVLALCALDKRVTPCIDFGHLNARTGGGIRTKADYARILDTMEQRLADERAANFHAHFSKIEYTVGGEKRHLTFADETFGPDYEPLLELCYERGLCPTVICESDGTQAEDVATMMRYYRSLAAASES